MNFRVVLGIGLGQPLAGTIPNAASGLDGVVAFFTKVMKVKRMDKCDRMTTEVVAVIAADDYVTVLIPRKDADSRNPGKEYYTTWFDTWRSSTARPTSTGIRPRVLGGRTKEGIHDLSYHRRALDPVPVRR